MEELISQLISMIDILFIVVCNAATYFVITFVGSIKEKTKLKTWHKRLLSTIMAIILGYVFSQYFGHSLEGVVAGFFLQFITYDYLIKPVIKKLQKQAVSMIDESGDSCDDERLN